MQMFDYVSSGTLTAVIVILAILIAIAMFKALRDFVSRVLGWSLTVFALLVFALIAARVYQGASGSIAVRGVFDDLSQFDTDLFVLIILALLFGGFGAWKWGR